jgi:hypothetical protein
VLHFTIKIFINLSIPSSEGGRALKWLISISPPKMSVEQNGMLAIWEYLLASVFKLNGPVLSKIGRYRGEGSLEFSVPSA